VDRLIIRTSAVTAFTLCHSAATVFKCFDILLLSAAFTKVNCVSNPVGVLIGMNTMKTLLAGKRIQRSKTNEREKKLFHKIIADWLEVKQ